MADEVKFIFKTLIKVPVIIFVAFFIMNIFAFFFIYFKMLGLSYVVMQETVDKNYIASRQQGQILKSLQDVEEIQMASNAGIVIGKDSNGNDVYVNTSGVSVGTVDKGKYRSALTKTQYGSVKYVGVRVGYTLVWPLSYKETTINNTGVDGLNGDDFQGFKSDSQLAKDRKNSNETITISITYEVPGLKYYADK